MQGKASALRPPLGLSHLPAVAVFARAPVAGLAKTRLIPMIGAPAAAGFQAALISDTLRKVHGLKGLAQPYLFLAGNSINFGGSVARASRRLSRQRLAPAPPRAEGPRHSGREARDTLSWPPLGHGEFRVIRQQGKDLGERIENAFRRLLRRHARCVIIGTDSPLLPARILRQALGELQACESVLGPCPDGGYYLIGLRRTAGSGMLRDVFRSVRWSTALAFRDTLRNLLRLGLSCSVLEDYTDVDLPRDVQSLKEDLSRMGAARRLAPATWNFLKRISLLPRDAVGPNGVRPL